MPVERLYILRYPPERGHGAGAEDKICRPGPRKDHLWLADDGTR